MSQFYPGQNASTCTEDPYAEVKALLQSAASNEYSRLYFYDIQRGQRGYYSTYGSLKELRQKASA